MDYIVQETADKILLETGDGILVEIQEIVTVKINNIDRNSLILWRTLQVKKELNSSRDVCKFTMRKNATVTPSYSDDIKVYDQEANLIFGGTVLRMNETTDAGSDTLIYEMEAVDYSYEMNRELVAETYEAKTINEIITDILSLYATDFNADNVDTNYEISNIIFNQIPVADCIQRLADIVGYSWYVDPNKSVHFFSKGGKLAPYDLTDTSGNFVFKSLRRTVDGSQLVNVVKVRGGTYTAEAFTDSITVSGSDSKSFKINYQMADLTVKLNTIAQTVGIKNIDSFVDHDVLYEYQTQTIEWENELTDSDVIEYSGSRKARVLAIAEDADSKVAYGTVEKLIRDNGINSNTIARKRATAELFAYAQTLVDGKFKTYNLGLDVGQRITITSDIRNSDNKLLIKTLTFRMLDPINFGYNVDLISTKRNDLIQLLANLLKPDDLNASDEEVSEKIVTDTAEISIDEEIERVTLTEDFASLAIGEEFDETIDPSTLIWVWGSYTLTGISDVKRAPNWSRGATWA